MTRREWISASSAALGAACGRKKGTGYAGYALIATSGDESLAVVDLTAFRLLKPVFLGAPPTRVATSPLDGRNYVLTGSTGSVHVIDGSLKRALSKRVSGDLSDFRVVPNGKGIVAITAVSRELLELDATSLSVIRRHKIEAQPIAMDVSSPQYSVFQYAAISTGGHGLVELFNLVTGQRSRTRISGEIGAVQFRRDGRVLLVANLHERLLTALAVPSLEVIAELPLAMLPENLSFNADGGQLFVSGAGMDGVAIVFPYNMLEVEQTVLAGRAPGVMACSETPPYLFVGSRDASDVCILDVGTRKMIGIVEVGGVPGCIIITPDSQYALVLDEKTGDMAVIHIPAIRGNRLKSGASLFTMIPVGEKPVAAAIVARST